MEQIRVCKFGGSSVADIEGLKNVRRIIKGDSSRKIIIFSALGRSNKYSQKITDLLIHAYQNPDCFEQDMLLMQNRFEELCKTLNLDFNVKKEIERIKRHYKFFKNKSYLFSRGEYLSAKIFARNLKIKFVDCAKVIKFSLSGKVKKSTYRKIKKLQKKHGRIVLPGFYGSNVFGKIKVMSRGGSDITGAICTKAIDGSIYENWTDVDGAYISKQYVKSGQKPLSFISYDDIKFLSFFGSGVLHYKCANIVNKHKTIIRNTFNPEIKGTEICYNAPKVEGLSSIDVKEIVYDNKNKSIEKLLKKSKVEKLFSFTFLDKTHVGFVTSLGYTNFDILQKIKSICNEFNELKIAAVLSPYFENDIKFYFNGGGREILIKKT